MLVWVVYPSRFLIRPRIYPTLLLLPGVDLSRPSRSSIPSAWKPSIDGGKRIHCRRSEQKGVCRAFGVAWNEQISKDHGGQAIQDYLSAIDELAKEKFVDKDRLGCVGASYGGYSVFLFSRHPSQPVQDVSLLMTAFLI